MAVLPNHHDLQQRLQDYRAFDDARQSEVDFLVQTCMRLNTERLTLQSDLDDERDTRRSWKKRAEQAEAATQRKFVVVLVDGDGYQFRKSFYDALATSGGSKAASELYTEVLNNLKTAVSSSGINADCDVLVNIYANKTGLARTLVACDYIHHPSQIDQFFCSFTQSRSLFQFIDCGPGKERVDAKLRDTFRFYAHNAQCQRIYLACSHDNGYIAELDKYRHDMIVMPKVMLIHAAQTPSAARAYAGLPFKYTRFDSVFEVSGLQTVSKADTSYSTPPPDTPYFDRSPTEQHIHELTPTASRSSHSSNIAPCGSTPLAPVTLNTKSAAQVSSPAPAPPPPPPTAEVAKTQPANTSDRTGEGKNGIPINRFGQRIDWKLRIPTTAEMDEFERRIVRRKLCNEHHLRDNCESYNCKYDHGPIDASLKNTLRYKARSIPCTHGSKCRRQDCFYGHQCPWGNNDCGNPKCSFIKTGLHDIKDLEISRVVAAQPEN
ncbi:hypothetical protein LTS15_007199 [Exophiala xenobiotica]|nr:hypothetical protein LTS15_007199 [Exophiala xenobiotica]